MDASNTPAIEVNGLSFDYQTRAKVLDNIHLKISKGSRTLLVRILMALENLLCVHYLFFYGTIL